MSNTKTLRVPAQLRKHVMRTVKPKTQGERELMAACEAGARELEAQGRNNMNSIDLDLTNDALGVVLKLARGWLDSDNGNNVMAAKSMLKYELEYTPDDPRETRHEVKFPKSVAGLFPSPYDLSRGKAKGIPKAVQSELGHLSWASAGTSGRVIHATLGWLLDHLKKQWDHPTPAVQRAVRKFIGTYTEPYEKTQRLINGYLGTGEDEDQAPEPEKDEDGLLTAAGLMQAISGRGGSEEQRKRLVVIACGGKKSQKPGKIPADERYIGNYFEACRLAAEVMDGPTMVLSAKYGLIPLSEEIENYNVRMGQPGSVGYGVLSQQVERLGLKDAKVTVLGGQDYVAWARMIWPDAEAPLKGGIGQQLKQLSEMYEGEVLEDDEHQDQEPGTPAKWRSGELRNVMGLPGRYHSRGLVIWFGGKAGKRNPEPGNWVKVNVIYTGEGRYDLIDVKTNEKVITCGLVSQIHWAPAQTPLRESEPAAVEEPTSPGDYEVPANFLELAEDANTEAARRYWKRRCDEWRRTGK
jgi:hypothetical protein